MTFPRTRLRGSPGVLARLGLACIGAVTGAFILLCLAELVQARQDATVAAETQARNVAASVAQDVARNLDLYDLSLQAAVQAVHVPGVMQLAPDIRRMVLFPRAARGPYFSFINVLNASGAVIADSDSATPRGGNYAGRDYFVAQRNDARDVLFIGAPFLTQPGQSPTISISRRISNPDGSFGGVVVGSMRLAYFRGLFSRLNLGSHGTIALLRRDGVILMRLPFNPDDIGRTLPPGAPYYRAMAGGQVDAADPSDHLRRRFLFQPIGTLPLVVGVGLANTDIYSAWRGQAVALGLALSALGAIDLSLLLVLHAALRRRDQGEAALRESHARSEALAAQREAALAAMAQTAAAKGRFLAAMSHELRTPLNSILGYSELLALDGTLAPTQAARLAAMRGAGEHLLTVIDRVLDFSRLEANVHPVPRQHTSLPGIVSDCRAMVAPLAERKGLALTDRISFDVPDDVLADAAGLREVILNLLGNAVKFTDQGSVDLAVSRGTTGILFTVTDTGTGVAPDLRDKLFQAYERGNADRRGVPGTGLGLAIADALVRRMGGRIGHDDNPGGGSVFWFEVPLSKSSLIPAAGPITAAPNRPRPLRVLVVDDSALNRDVAASFLRRAGHTVIEAEDGEVAVSRAAAQDFDVVLMDIRMPRLDGIAAARLIRALPAPYGNTAIIAVTAYGGDADLAANDDAGFQACLLKPITRQGLLSAIAAATNPNPAGVLSGIPPEPLGTQPAPAPAGAESPNSAAMERHVAEFADMLDRVDALLGEQNFDPSLLDLVHRVAGDAAQLGYAALADSARQVEAALRRDDSELSVFSAALLQASTEVLTGLNQRGDLARKAAMASMKLPLNRRCSAA